jgi:hypothetical protein
MKRCGSLVALAILAATPAWAIFLDDARYFKLTGQFYTQSRIRTTDSEKPTNIDGGGTEPITQAGQLIQWRNFAYPIFEGNLNKPLGLSFLDDLSFRFGGRFIYEGIYDVGTDQFRRELRRHIVSAASPGPHPGLLDANRGIGLGGNEPIALYRGTKPVETVDPPGVLSTCGDPLNAPFFTPPGTLACANANAGQRAARLRDQEIFDPRSLFAQQVDPWEIYINIEKRPFFFRIGRQTLAWGESDGQRLLDGINPLDRLFGLPFDEDIDEQRIPNWMIRSNVQLINALGPLSSFGVESFLVPGVIDTTQGPVPLFNDYPYAPPAGCDPQFIANEKGVAGFGGVRPPNEGCTRSFGPGGQPMPILPRGTIQTSIYERLPPHRMDNSRYGVRFVGVLFRDYTFSLGAYHSYSDAPQPRVHYTDMIVLPGCDPNVDVNGPACRTPPLPTHVVAELTHKQLNVIGGTISFFQPRVVPGVVRAEVGYFLREPALVPVANQGWVPLLQDLCGGPFHPLDQPPNCQRTFIHTFVPKADWLRWVIGYDMYQINVPWISRTNNIIIVAQYFSELNLSGKGLLGLARSVGLPCNTCSQSGSEDLGKFDLGNTRPDGSRNTLPHYHGFGNITFQAFMMHGLLVPRLTFVGDIVGWGAALPSVEYRVTDNILARLSYSTIFGAFDFGGLFRDRDQVGARLTYQFS